MMPHENKDELLRLFYREAAPPEEQKMREHLAGCDDCREYMRFLQQMNGALSRWQDETPLPNTFDKILSGIPPEYSKAVYVKPVSAARPIFQIVFALISILLLIYFVQSQVSTLPLWQSLAQWRVVQTLGSFGFVTLVFFSFGTFITLALAPILYFDLNKRTLHI